MFGLIVDFAVSEHSCVAEKRLLKSPIAFHYLSTVSSNHIQRRDHHIAYRHVHTSFARGVRRRRGGGAGSLSLMSDHIASHGTHRDSHFRNLRELL